MTILPDQIKQEPGPWHMQQKYQQEYLRQAINQTTN